MCPRCSDQCWLVAVRPPPLCPSRSPSDSFCGPSLGLLSLHWVPVRLQEKHWGTRLASCALLVLLRGARGQAAVSLGAGPCLSQGLAGLCEWSPLRGCLELLLSPLPTWGGCLLWGAGQAASDCQGTRAHVGRAGDTEPVPALALQSLPWGCGGSSALKSLLWSWAWGTRPSQADCSVGWSGQRFCLPSFMCADGHCFH